MARSYMDELIYVIGYWESRNTYDAVNPEDVVSIGYFQWYGARALGLARAIANADPSGSENALAGASTPLYQQITGGSNTVWNSYRPGGSSTADHQALKRFLQLPASKTAQGALLQEDGGKYSAQAQSMGIVVPAAQIYFADLYNQSPKQAIAIVKAAGGGAVCSLSVIHQYAMRNSVMSEYAKRRDWVYAELQSWSGDTDGGYQPPPTDPVNPPGQEWEGETGVEVKYYMLRWNGHMVLYSDEHKDGLVFIPSGNVYIPLDPPTKVAVWYVGSVDDMTDISKVYVLNSTGNIWVYNGVKFIDTNQKYQK